jgi:hypothetical protein
MIKSIILITAISLLVGCGDSKVIDGVTIPTYGVYDKDELKCDNVHYSIVGQNVVVSVLSPYTVVVPALLIMFDLFEPEGKIDSTKPIDCK